MIKKACEILKTTFDVKQRTGAPGSRVAEAAALDLWGVSSPALHGELTINQSINDGC